MNSRKLRRLALILALVFAWPLLASADNSTGGGATTASADDARMKALEEQLRQQQEQNRQIMETLKNMQQGQQGAGAAATPPAAAPQQQTAVIPAPSQGQPAVPAPAIIPPPVEKLTPGWLACIMSASVDDKNSNFHERDSIQLSDKLGCFLASKESYDYNEYMKIPGMPKDPKIGWKGEAFFETKEQGRHSFIVNVKFTTARWGTGVTAGIVIEGNEIFRNKKRFDHDDLCDPSKKNMEVCGSFVGGADLEPGRYKVEFWIHPSTMDDFREFKNASLQVFTKKPSDALPVPAYQSMLVRAQK